MPTDTISSSFPSIEAHQRAVEALCELAFELYADAHSTLADGRQPVRLGLELIAQAQGLTNVTAAAEWLRSRVREIDASKQHLAETHGQLIAHLASHLNSPDDRVALSFEPAREDSLASDRHEDLTVEDHPDSGATVGPSGTPLIAVKRMPSGLWTVFHDGKPVAGHQEERAVRVIAAGLEGATREEIVSRLSTLVETVSVTNRTTADGSGTPLPANPVSYVEKQIDAWSKNHGCADLESFWARCDQGDLMLYYAGLMAGPPASESRRALVRTAKDCAAFILPHWQSRFPKENKLQQCLDLTDRWAQGKEPIDAVKLARQEAAAAGSAALFESKYLSDSDAAAAVYRTADIALCERSAPLDHSTYDPHCAATTAAAVANHAASAYAEDLEASDRVLSHFAGVVREHYPQLPRTIDHTLRTLAVPVPTGPGAIETEIALATKVTHGLSIRAPEVA